MRKPQDDQPLVCRKQTAARMLSVSLSRMQQMMASGDLKAVPLGPRAIGITYESIQRVAREGVRRPIKAVEE